MISVGTMLAASTAPLPPDTMSSAALHDARRGGSNADRSATARRPCPRCPQPRAPVHHDVAVVVEQPDDPEARRIAHARADRHREWLEEDLVSCRGDSLKPLCSRPAHSFSLLTHRCAHATPLDLDEAPPQARYSRVLASLVQKRALRARTEEINCSHAKISGVHAEGIHIMFSTEKSNRPEHTL